MPAHEITVPTRDELDLTVAYLKQHYVVVEKQPDVARMRLAPKRFWHYIGSFFMGLIFAGPFNPEQFPVSEAVRNIPHGTTDIEIRVASKIASIGR